MKTMSRSKKFVNLEKNPGHIKKKTAYHAVGQLVITKSTYRKDDHDTKPT